MIEIKQIMIHICRKYAFLCKNRYLPMQKLLSANISG